MDDRKEKSISIPTELRILGMIIAVVVSWSVNGSILWATLRGICGWLYVIYYLVT